MKNLLIKSSLIFSVFSLYCSCSAMQNNDNPNSAKAQPTKFRVDKEDLYNDVKVFLGTHPFEDDKWEEYKQYDLPWVNIPKISMEDPADPSKLKSAYDIAWYVEYAEDKVGKGLFKMHSVDIKRGQSINYVRYKMHMAAEEYKKEHCDYKASELGVSKGNESDNRIKLLLGFLKGETLNAWSQDTEKDLFKGWAHSYESAIENLKKLGFQSFDEELHKAGAEEREKIKSNLEKKESNFQSFCKNLIKVFENEKDQIKSGLKAQDNNLKKDAAKRYVKFFGLGEDKENYFDDIIKKVIIAADSTYFLKAIEERKNEIIKLAELTKKANFEGRGTGYSPEFDVIAAKFKEYYDTKTKEYANEIKGMLNWLKSDSNASVWESIYKQDKKADIKKLQGYVDLFSEEGKELTKKYFEVAPKSILLLISSYLKLHYEEGYLKDLFEEEDCPEELWGTKEVEKYRKKTYEVIKSIAEKLYAGMQRNEEENFKNEIRYTEEEKKAKPKDMTEIPFEVKKTSVRDFHRFNPPEKNVLAIVKKMFSEKLKLVGNNKTKLPLVNFPETTKSNLNTLLYTFICRSMASDKMGKELVALLSSSNGNLNITGKMIKHGEYRVVSNEKIEYKNKIFAMFDNEATDADDVLLYYPAFDFTQANAYKQANASGDLRSLYVVTNILKKLTLDILNPARLTCSCVEDISRASTFFTTWQTVKRMPMQKLLSYAGSIMGDGPGMRTSFYLINDPKVQALCDFFVPKDLKNFKMDSRGFLTPPKDLVDFVDSFIGNEDWQIYDFSLKPFLYMDCYPVSYSEVMKFYKQLETASPEIYKKADRGGAGLLLFFRTLELKDEKEQKFNEYFLSKPDFCKLPYNEKDFVMLMPDQEKENYLAERIYYGIFGNFREDFPGIDDSPILVAGGYDDFRSLWSMHSDSIYSDWRDKIVFPSHVGGTKLTSEENMDSDVSDKEYIIYPANGDKKTESAPRVIAKYNKQKKDQAEKEQRVEEIGKQVSLLMKK